MQKGTREDVPPDGKPLEGTWGWTSPLYLGTTKTVLWLGGNGLIRTF